MIELIHNMVQGLLALSESLGYWGILLLMTVESSFIPFPSELVVPPAAYLSAKGEMSVWLVMVMGVAGSVVGAVINYVIARSLGRTVIYAIAKRRYMRYLLITHHKLEKAEKYFLKYGNISTFIGRLIPGIRQLVSLPAGFAKMPFGSFVFYTFLGSSVWVPTLAMHGYLIGKNEQFLADNFWWVVGTVGGIVTVIVVGFWLWKRR